MGSTGAITSYFDVAQLVLYMFWLFFAGLIYYLVRENRREGYPLETHRGSSHRGWIDAPPPKTFLLDNGATVTIPKPSPTPESYSAERTSNNEGGTIEPVGNPLLAGVGSGAWAQRADAAELDHLGLPKVRPLSTLAGYDVSEKDPDPRGMTVLDANDDAVGTVRDMWLDAQEMIFRFAEVELADGSRRALVPVPFCRITRDAIKVHALLASQWADVPSTKASDRITLLEEDRIAAYFGAGLLYATPGRAEPLL